MSENNYNPIDFENCLSCWMTHCYNNYDDFKHKKIKDICISGTHDSGTYYLKKEIIPEADEVIKEIWDNAPLEAVTNVKNYMHGISVTQSKSILEQLEMGIRFFDLRICHKDGAFALTNFKDLSIDTVDSILEEVGYDHGEVEDFFSELGNDAWNDIKNLVPI